MAPLLPLEDEENEESVIAEPGGVELARVEKKPEAEEAGAGEEAPEAEEVGLYHPVVPELLSAFTEAVEILERLAEGTLTPSEAKAHYLEKVQAPVEAVAVDASAKPSRSKTRKRTRSTTSSKRSSKRAKRK
ncbi:MAG: hypothetical protein LRS49_05555 [Desulfurococcales archaeon]|nr:hypothetical protein [Desulfurococcales archaeon]